MRKERRLSLWAVLGYLWAARRWRVRPRGRGEGTALKQHILSPTWDIRPISRWSLRHFTGKWQKVGGEEERQRGGLGESCSIRWKDGTHRSKRTKRGREKRINRGEQIIWVFRHIELFEKWNYITVPWPRRLRRKQRRGVQGRARTNILLRWLPVSESQQCRLWLLQKKQWGGEKRESGRTRWTDPRGARWSLEIPRRNRTRLLVSYGSLQ